VLLGFDRPLEVGQAISPELLEVVPQPGKPLRAGTIQPSGPSAGDGNEADLLQDPQVLGDGRARHLELRGNFPRRELLAEHHPEDLPAARLGDGMENGFHFPLICSSGLR
jgi:hypothetical protein